MGISGHEIGPVRRLVNKLSAVASQPVTSLVCSVGLNEFHLFEPLKKRLAGKQFATDADVKQAVTSCLQTLETDFLYAEINALVQCWDTCLIKRQCRSDVYYLLHL